MQIVEFELPGPPGKRFDYLTIDEDDNYLLSAHLGAGLLHVVDLRANAVVKTVPNVPGIEGVAYIAEGKKIYTANWGENKIGPNSQGKVTRYGAFSEHVWRPLLTATKLPYRKPHAMRHSYAVAHARPTRTTPRGGARLRRAPPPVIRFGALGAPDLARLLGRDRAGRGRERLRYPSPCVGSQVTPEPGLGCGAWWSDPEWERANTPEQKRSFVLGRLHAFNRERLVDGCDVRPPQGEVGRDLPDEDLPSATARPRIVPDWRTRRRPNLCSSTNFHPSTRSTTTSPRNGGDREGAEDHQVGRMLTM
jgi:hypothetical protein